MGREEHGARPQNSADLAACKTLASRDKGNATPQRNSPQVARLAPRTPTRVSNRCGNRSARPQRRIQRRGKHRITAAAPPPHHTRTDGRTAPRRPRHAMGRPSRARFKTRGDGFTRRRESGPENTPRPRSDRISTRSRMCDKVLGLPHRQGHRTSLARPVRGRCLGGRGYRRSDTTAGARTQAVRRAPGT